MVVPYGNGREQIEDLSLSSFLPGTWKRDLRIPLLLYAGLVAKLGTGAVLSSTFIPFAMWL